ncbi:cell division transport system permease protein [Marmoricola sp. OAE513]|uniref:permease-like cell division protein FtsX n=1 Tax=Marmoricola sp. OAE513 TaxID=2817894 RepID=UPI001AE773C0
MQIKYALSETRTGLRRNVSMTVALVVTIFISLTLVGLGILLNTQANSAREAWGDKLQLTVFLCNNAPAADAANQTGPCTSGETTPAQKAAIEDVLKKYPEVKSYTTRSKEEAYAIWKRIYDTPRSEAERAVFKTVTAETMQESYLVTLEDPNKFQGITSALEGMQGVDHVQDFRTVLKPLYFVMGMFKWGAIGIAAFLLAAGVLQVSNSIRLAVFARRKEIGIMRLVGASNLYIALPFLMETLVAALIAVVLSGGALAAFMEFAVYGWLRDNSRVMPWITWSDALTAGWMIGALGIVLTVIPTLVMTRKYLKV